MLPCKRVKLNRVALKDVVGLKLTPRRRSRKAAIDVPPDSSEQQERALSEQTSASVSGDRNQQSQSLEKQNDAPKGRLEESCAAAQKATRRTGLHSNTGDEMESKRSRVNTRDFIKSSHPNPSEHTSSEGCPRRSVGAALCLLCGECKYISPRRRKLDKQEQKSCNTDSGGSSVAFKVCGEKRAVETKEKIIVWINEYPKVKLCDVASRCDVCSHKCGYVLPDDLKEKKMRCFKQDLRPEFRFWPSCVGQSKHDGEQSAGVGNGNGGPSVQCGNSICLAESLTEQHKHSEGGTEARKSPSKRLHNGLTDANTSSPVSEHTDDEEIRTRVSGRGSQGDAALESDQIGLEILRNEKMKLGDGVSKENSAISRPDHPGDRTESDTVFSEREEVNMDESESFTCQRVKPWEVPISCARAYMSWPFSNHKPRCSAVSPRSASDSIKDSPNLPGSSIVGSLYILSDVSMGTKKKQEERKTLDSTQASLNITERSARSEGPVVHLHSASSAGSEPGSETGLSSTWLFNRPERNTSTSTQSDWEASSALSSQSEQFANDASSGLRLCSPPPSSLPSGKARHAAEDTLFSTCASSCQSLVSSTCLCKDQNNNNEDLLTRSPPTLELFDARPFNPQHLLMNNMTQENHVEIDSAEFLLPPMLSPVSSPYRHILGTQSLKSQNSSEDTEVVNTDKTPAGFYVPQWSNGNTELPGSSPEHHSKEVEGVALSVSTPTDTTILRSPSSPSNNSLESDGDRKETSDDPDSKENGECGEEGLEQVPFDPETRATVGSDTLSKQHGSVSDEEERSSATEEGSSSCNVEGDEREAGTAEEQQSAMLDELSAYEQDILLVDVTQEDLELFENMPEEKPITMSTQSSNKAGSSVLEQRFKPVTINFQDESGNNPEKSEISSQRPWCSSVPAKNPKLVTFGQSRHSSHSDGYKILNGSLESPPIHTVNSPHSVPPLKTLEMGPCMNNLPKVTSFRHKKSNMYCKNYFSEFQSCGFKMCRFQHLPVEGDERFCVDMVEKFAKKQACLEKAEAVFTGYYQSSPPGVNFSMPVLLALLWALLEAGMVLHVFSVLRVSLTYKIEPGHEFLLAFVGYIRDKRLMRFVPELVQLTFEMDFLNDIKKRPMFQLSLLDNPSDEFLNLLHGVVEIELCAKQENWKRMGDVFSSICQFSQYPNQVEDVCGRIAVALLSESKDKVSLPFAAFTETVRHNECEKSPHKTFVHKTFVGRIGVSLMLRYYKNHHWAKGRRVVEEMSTLKIDYTTTKSLFRNDDKASRGCLITVATELFLLSGSVSEALNTLREHDWFLSSPQWPCDPTDLDSRTNVLIRCLAGETSHREKLEVLCNLPGVKEPNERIDISRYTPLFTAQLQSCVERQILPVASDTLDFMLCKQLAVDHSLLHTLLEKLGSPKLLLQARKLFKHSLSAGYYPGVSASAGVTELIVPWRLGEVEFALTLEMFVAFNARTISDPVSDPTASPLCITLKRTESSEGDYMSAGNRLHSAARRLQPELVVDYTGVSSCQEQVFTLDRSSAHSWLRLNQWISKMWTH